MKNFPAVFIFVLAAVIFMGGCSPKSNTPAAAPVLAGKAVVTHVPVQIQPPPVGHVVAYSSVTVRPQVGGVLQQVHFKEGTAVKKGDLLFTIDPRPMQAALEQAQAALKRDTAQMKNAEIQFNREKKLFEQKLISQDEFDTSRANFDALTGTVAADSATVTNAQLNLDYTEIRAPFDGMAGGLQFHEGNVLKAPDDTLLTINRIHPIYVQFAVPERYLPEIKKQMAGHTLKVSAATENMAGDPPQGELTFLDNAVDMGTGTIQLKATFANEDNALWPGQFVKVNLTLSELTNAVVVPSQAVQTGQNGQFVYVVGSYPADPEVEERPVTIGIAYDGETVIEKGLNAGEMVVTDGQLRLSPKARVNVKMADTGNTNSPAK